MIGFLFGSLITHFKRKSRNFKRNVNILDCPLLGRLLEEINLNLKKCISKQIFKDALEKKFLFCLIQKKIVLKDY